MGLLELIKLLSNESTKITNEQIKNIAIEVIRYSAFCDGVIIVIIIACAITLLWNDSKIEKKIDKKLKEFAKLEK